MNERWVCKRCFADNEDSATVCANCELVRGAESSEADRAWWAASTGAPQPGASDAGGTRWLRFAWIPVVAIVVLVGFFASARRDDTGLIAAGGTLSVADLRIGDCFNVADADEISEVDAHPCNESHRYELFHVATWDAGGDYPTEQAMIDFVIRECVPAFDDYVGMAFQRSTLDFIHFAPLEAGWIAGDRIFQCALFDPFDEELHESLEGVAR